MKRAQVEAAAKSYGVELFRALDALLAHRFSGWMVGSPAHLAEKKARSLVREIRKAARAAEPKSEGP